MKIAVLLSGGVDSSVALSILKDQGHDLTAFYLKIWLEDELSYLGNCPWKEDLKYAKAVCKKFGVPLNIVSMQKEYWDKVVAYALKEVKNGRTPSPDIFCNKYIKFGCFFEKIGDQFDYVATGHYGQLEENNGKILLKKAADSVKDQTYFLSHLNQKQLSCILFPIGHFTKKQVRELAEKYDLPNKNRKDSQGICFLGKIKFNDFIKHHLSVKKGEIIDYESGKKVGEHDGFWYYTIGQRKGIGLSDGPWYVVEKNPEKNIVYVSNKYFTMDKKRDRLKVSNFNWISCKIPQNLDIEVKVRHGEKLYKCHIDFLQDDLAIVKLNERDQGLAPGQFAVFYENDVCLGCGVIS